MLRGTVTTESVAKLQIEAMEMSAKLQPQSTIYLVLDTPGGSVTSGLELIDFLKALPQRIKTVTVFAASMGFQIAQNMDERLILPSATLMSHKASVSGLSGEVPGELTSRLGHIMRILKRMDKIAAKRMCVSDKKYSRLIQDELWMDGQDAIDLKAADRMLLAKCDRTLQGTTRIPVGQFMGILITAEMSNCPLVTGMLNVRMEAGNEASEADKEAAEELTQAFKIGRKRVVQKFVTTGRLL